MKLCAGELYDGFFRSAFFVYNMRKGMIKNVENTPTLEKRFWMKAGTKANRRIKSGFAETFLLLSIFFRVIYYARVQCYFFSKSDRLTCLNAEQQEHLDDLQVDVNRDDITSSAGYHFDIIIDTSLRIRHEPGI